MTAINDATVMNLCTEIHTAFDDYCTARAVLQAELVIGE